MVFRPTSGALTRTPSTYNSWAGALFRLATDANPVTGIMPPRAQHWMSKLCDSMRRNLAAHALVETNSPIPLTLLEPSQTGDAAVCPLATMQELQHVDARTQTNETHETGAASMVEVPSLWGPANNNNATDYLPFVLPLVKPLP